MAWFAFPAEALDTPDLFDTETGNRIAPAALIERLSEHRHILLGEKHDNPKHHAIQSEILAGLIARGRRPAVVWEMVPHGRQAAIDSLAREGALDPDRFAAGVGWADSGWPDWRYYRPIAEAGLSAGLKMMAGNLDRGEVGALFGGLDALAPDRHAALRLDRPIPEPVSDALLDEVFHGHCALMPRTELQPMVTVQFARDASLAEAMVRAARMEDGAVLIAGSQHARRDIGAAHHLMDRFGEADLVALALRERGKDGSAELTPAMRSGFDFVWFTDPVPDKDYCAGLRKRLRKP